MKRLMRANWCVKMLARAADPTVRAEVGGPRRPPRATPPRMHAATAPACSRAAAPADRPAPRCRPTAITGVSTRRARGRRPLQIRGDSWSWLPVTFADGQKSNKANATSSLPMSRHKALSIVLLTAPSPSLTGQSFRFKIIAASKFVSESADCPYVLPSIEPDHKEEMMKNAHTQQLG